MRIAPPSDSLQLGQFIPLHYHHSMLADRARTGSFLQAIDKVVRPGSTLVDLGSGTGILSFFAARHAASRLACRPELTTDSLGVYANAVFDAFAGLGVDYATIHKVYESTQSDGRYSPACCVGCEKRNVFGSPRLERVGTSRIERANLTLRMSQRRWTRLTNAHSKKFDNMQAAFALHSCYYNWCRKHATIGTTPAVKLGIADRIWTVGDLVGLLEADEQAEIAAGSLKRGSYKLRQKSAD